MLSNEMRLNEGQKHKTKATKMTWKKEHLNGQTINKIIKKREEFCCLLAEGILNEIHISHAKRFKSENRLCSIFIGKYSSPVVPVSCALYTLCRMAVYLYASKHWNNIVKIIMEIGPMHNCLSVKPSSLCSTWLNLTPFRFCLKQIILLWNFNLFLDLKMDILPQIYRGFVGYCY